jgi:N-acetylglucosamine-6-phosphate deacetylase|tara:strand:+ start:1042 stop:2217 length:1176 start_codon:yes stop_codon:yes gene_type:complete
MTKVFTNCSIFNGETFIGNRAVVVEGSKIIKVVHKSNLTGYNNITDLKGALLVPGFIDLQVNGGGGAFYTQEASIDNYIAANKAHLGFGTTALLPTLISTSLDNIIAQCAVGKELMKDPKNGVLGIHVEGPFFNPEKKGAHSLDFVREATDYEIEKIIEAGRGVIKLFTCAPEVVSTKHIKMLVEAGIPVSAGHSNCTYEQAMNAFEAGVTKVTHLYNAMSQFTSRAPGLVGAFLDSNDKVYGGIIVDGIHCDYAALRIAQKAKREKLFLVSDASFVKHPVDSFEIDEFKIFFKDGMYLTETGNLAGSAVSMLDSVQNCFNEANIELAETLKMSSRYPAEFMGIDNEYGYIKKGYYADFVVLERDTLKLLDVYKCGEQMEVDELITTKSTL